MRATMAMLLLLTACEGRAPDDTAAPAGEAAGAALPAAAGPGGDNPLALQAQAAAALAGILADAENARYADLRRAPGGAICGTVDPAQRGGGYAGARPFVVSPDGIAFVSRSGEIAFADPTDPYPDFHMRWCASPEELRMLGPMAGRIAAAPLPEPPPVPDLPDLPADLAEAEPAPPPEPAPKAAPPPARPADTDSFADAVLRPPPAKDQVQSER